MNYRPRHIEEKLCRFASFFKAVLVVGARQVGKSSLLAATFPEYHTVVLDAREDLYGARIDPDLFLKNFPPPLIIDEIQYAPELLPALKRRLDIQNAPGRYLLTGSHQFQMMRGVLESLAGRVGILHLSAMTPAEMAGEGNHPSNFLGDWLTQPGALKPDIPLGPEPPGGLARMLWRGCLPGLLDAPDDLVGPYLQSYLTTYIERDIRLQGDIRDIGDFDRFLRLTAALTAQELNLSQIGREIGISPVTARSWLDLLEHGFQWYPSQPWYKNTVKRLSKRPKGHIEDTGLACALLRIGSPAALASHPLFGALFESFVVGIVRKHAARLQLHPGIYHWRTAAGAEVDLVLEADGKLYPIEIKASTVLSGHDARGLMAFRDTYPQQSTPGLLIYAGDIVRQVTKDIWAIPWRAL